MKKKFLIPLFIFIAVVISIQGGNDNKVKTLPIKYTSYEMGLDTRPLKAFEYQVEDLPKECNIRIEIMSMDRKSSKSYGRLDKNGFVIGENGKKWPFVFNCGYGEPMSVAISQAWFPLSDKVGLLFFTPYPLEASDEHGHRFTIIAKNTEGTKFELHLSGFEAGETILYQSSSCHEKIQEYFQADEQGEIIIHYWPAVIGKSEGPFRITFSNKMHKLSLQHYWGTIAFTSLLEYQELQGKFPEFFKENNTP